MVRAIKISEYSLLAAIATIFLKKPILVGIYDIKLSVLFFAFFAISLLFLLIASLYNQVSIFSEKKLNLVLLLCFASLAIGTLTSFLIYHQLPGIILAKEYCHALASFFIFWEILLLSKYIPQFPKRALLAFLSSFVLIPLIYFFSLTNDTRYLLYGTTRFDGFLNDPNYHGNLQIIPTLLLLFFIITSKRKMLWNILLFFGLCVSVGTILWSGSRSGILGLFAAFTFFIYFMAKRMQNKKVLLTALLILISFPIGYFILPQKTHDNIDARVTQITNKAPAGKPTSLDLTAGQDRTDIWLDSLAYIKKNPLGYGPGYYEIVNIVNNDNDHLVSHNFELGILLSGGIMLLVIINVGLFYIVTRPMRSPYFRHFGEMHVLLAIFAGILVSSLFNDFLFLEWIWIIAALIVSYHRQLASN